MRAFIANRIRTRQRGYAARTRSGSGAPGAVDLGRAGGDEDAKRRSACGEDPARERDEAFAVAARGLKNLGFRDAEVRRALASLAPAEHDAPPSVV